MVTAMEDRGVHDRPEPGLSSNRVGCSSRWLASHVFNEAPAPLHLSGVREMNPGLFTMLDQAPDLPEAGRAFSCYLRAMFGIDPEQQADRPGERRPFRSSFLRLIQGWNFDSNGPEGAVLKGWVESRFGISPSFHKALIEQVPGPVWQAYVEEMTASRFHENAIWTQLDLLFEFAQWAIARFAFPGQLHLTLFRGINAVGRHAIIERKGPRRAVIRLNNLVSFSSEREVACCFGDAILTARVPLSKILFFNDLLPNHPMRGEGEFLAIGGEYEVCIDYV